MPAGTYGIVIGGQGVGQAISGLVVRGNTVYAPNSLLLAYDVTHLTSVLVENNQGSLSPSTSKVVPTLSQILFNNNHP
jgi:hypothetical protein